MIVGVVLGVVSALAIFVIALAYRERDRLLTEVRAVTSGIERRTAEDGETNTTLGLRPSAELELLLDDAVQSESNQLAVLAANELLGRAGLARNRAHLLSRGLPRIALLSGGGGAFVIVAVGHFSKSSLLAAVGSVAIGLLGGFTCHGLTSSCRRLAKKYVGIVDALARQIERHFGGGS